MIKSRDFHNVEELKYSEVMGYILKLGDSIKIER